MIGKMGRLLRLTMSIAIPSPLLPVSPFSASFFAHLAQRGAGDVPPADACVYLSQRAAHFYYGQLRASATW